MFILLCVEIKKEGNMFEKILTVLSKNLGYSVVLAVALLLFAVFSDGLVPGLITAVSALLVYTCVAALYKEYKALPAKKPVAAKKAAPAKKKAKK
jgi:uncharacterized membrane protein YjfL (UPF0719 family)